MSENVMLDVTDLSVAFQSERGLLRAVDGVTFSLAQGKTLGIVGESGCGKSVTAMSLVRLLPQPAGQIVGGRVTFCGADLASVSDAEMRAIRGKEIGVIFQEPMTALNPVHPIGRQVAEVFHLHSDLSKNDALTAAVDLLKLVKIPAAEKRIFDYPHQLSGGMRQRVVIALALALQPKLVIADEPTTALDVTVQAQILDLIEDLQQARGMSMILITHDLGVIAESCDDVVVMYAGRVVERGSVKEIFTNPQHAYTRGLLRSMPSLAHEPKSLLPTIPGTVASLADFVDGCRFCQRVGGDGAHLPFRPRLEEISVGHWVEACPICYQGKEQGIWLR